MKNIKISTVLRIIRENNALDATAKLVAACKRLS